MNLELTDQEALLLLELIELETAEEFSILESSVLEELKAEGKILESIANRLRRWEHSFPIYGGAGR